MLADVRETHKLVIRHIQKVRQIPGLEDATVVLVLESNLAFEAQVRHYSHTRPILYVPDRCLPVYSTSCTR